MSIKLNPPRECPQCKKLCSWFTGNICHNCYRNFKWERKKFICPKCKRLKYLKAKGLCGGCYNTTYHLEATKNHNYKRYHNIEPALYKQITQKCLICGFDKVVDLHHLDKNHKNNSINNMVGLCPNHHKMLHNLKYKDEMLKQINSCLNNVQTPLKQPTTEPPLAEPEAQKNEELHNIKINQDLSVEDDKL